MGRNEKSDFQELIINCKQKTGTSYKTLLFFLRSLHEGASVCSVYSSKYRVGGIERKPGDPKKREDQAM